MMENTQHPVFLQPQDGDAILWRYLDFYKFQWLVENKRLFMPHVSNLGDELEGTQPQGDMNWWNRLATNAKSLDEQNNINRNSKLLPQFAAAFRTRYYVSSWHMNAKENDLMWSKYCNSYESVAIQITLKELRTALHAFVQIGMVRYINYAVERFPTFNMFEYITHKEASFAWEQELRAVAMHPVVDSLDKVHFEEHHFKSDSATRQLVYAPTIDVQSLIKAVVLHPEATEVFADQIALICSANALPAPQKSVLSSLK